MNTSELVHPNHVQRQAVVYVRQSSPHQALANQESLQMQYGLRQRAVELGWMADDVQVVDSDVGRTGSTTKGRHGFQQLVADVSLGRVGIILAYDATRLARNCSDWYQLLDLCGYRSCLIADRDGIYDPSSINGRMLLGLKGQISELELHTLRARLTAGILHKAQRGELALTLPTGLVRDDTGQVFKHPNLEVQSRLDLVFDTFLQQKSASKAVRFFKDHDLTIPRRTPQGEIRWRAATEAAICSILKHPAYAGAYTYGRTRATPRPDSGKKSLQKPIPREQWKVCIRDRYPAYISWETHERIEAMLCDNYAEYDRNKTRGVPRPGKALLHGLMFCGECGHKMVVQYKGGTHYLCNYLRQQYQVPVCQYIPADPVDDHVVELFLDAFSAVELDLHDKVVENARQEREEVLRSHQQQLERLRYRARLAERQFNLSDPDNRLVTAELERRWEQALRDLKAAEEAFERQQQQHPSLPPLDAATRKVLENVGKNLPELWTKARLSQQQKKALLRSLIDKVVIHRVKRDTIRTRVIWKGGEVSTAEVPIPVGSLAELSQAKEMESQVVELSSKGHSDEEIAERLTRAGHRSPLRRVVLPSTVKTIRLRHRIMTTRHQSHPRQVPGHLTVPQLAEKLGVSRYWIYDRINNGTIQVTKDKELNLYLFPDRAKTLERFGKLVAGKLHNLRF
jgi:DNA invertase Pin-like site-specific DNA recombinase/predicted DNA-binding transcriptional regulator AlpA